MRRGFAASPHAASSSASLFLSKNQSKKDYASTISHQKGVSRFCEYREVRSGAIELDAAEPNNNLIEAQTNYSTCSSLGARSLALYVSTPSSCSSCSSLSSKGSLIIVSQRRSLSLGDIAKAMLAEQQRKEMRRARDENNKEGAEGSVHGSEQQRIQSSLQQQPLPTHNLNTVVAPHHVSPPPGSPKSEGYPPTHSYSKSKTSNGHSTSTTYSNSNKRAADGARSNLVPRSEWRYNNNNEKDNRSHLASEEAAGNSDRTANITTTTITGRTNTPARVARETYSGEAHQSADKGRHTSAAAHSTALEHSGGRERERESSQKVQSSTDNRTTRIHRKSEFIGKRLDGGETFSDQRNNSHYQQREQETRSKQETRRSDRPTSPSSPRKTTTSSSSSASWSSSPTTSSFAYNDSFLRAILSTSDHVESVILGEVGLRSVAQRFSRCGLGLRGGGARGAGVGVGEKGGADQNSLERAIAANTDDSGGIQLREQRLHGFIALSLRMYEEDVLQYARGQILAVERGKSSATNIGDKDTPQGRSLSSIASPLPHNSTFSASHAYYDVMGVSYPIMKSSLLLKKKVPRPVRPTVMSNKSRAELPSSLLSGRTNLKFSVNSMTGGEGGSTDYDLHDDADYGSLLSPSSVLYLNAPTRCASLDDIVSTLKLMGYVGLDSIELVGRELRQLGEATAQQKESAKKQKSQDEGRRPPQPQRGRGESAEEEVISLITTDLLEDLDFRVTEMHNEHERKTRFAAKTSTSKVARPVNPTMSSKNANTSDSSPSGGWVAETIEPYPFTYDVGTALTFGILRRIRWILETNPLVHVVELAQRGYVSSSSSSSREIVTAPSDSDNTNKKKEERAGATKENDKVKEEESYEARTNKQTPALACLQRYYFLGVDRLSRTVHFLVEQGLDGVCPTTFSMLAARLHAEMELESQGVSEWSTQLNRLVTEMRVELRDLRERVSGEALPELRVAYYSNKKRQHQQQADHNDNTFIHSSQHTQQPLFAKLETAISPSPAHLTMPTPALLEAASRRAEQLQNIAGELNQILSHCAFVDGKGGSNARQVVTRWSYDDDVSDKFTKKDSVQQYQNPQHQQPFPFPSPSSLAGASLLFHSHGKAMKAYSASLSTSLGSLIDRHTHSLYLPHHHQKKGSDNDVRIGNASREHFRAITDFLTRSGEKLVKIITDRERELTEVLSEAKALEQELTSALDGVMFEREEAAAALEKERLARLEQERQQQKEKVRGPEELAGDVASSELEKEMGGRDAGGVSGVRQYRSSIGAALSGRLRTSRVLSNNNESQSHRRGDAETVNLEEKGTHLNTSTLKGIMSGARKTSGEEDTLNSSSPGIMMDRNEMTSYQEQSTTDTTTTTTTLIYYQSRDFIANAASEALRMMPMRLEAVRTSSCSLLHETKSYDEPNTNENDETLKNTPQTTSMSQQGHSVVCVSEDKLPTALSRSPAAAPSPTSTSSDPPQQRQQLLLQQRQYYSILRQQIALIRVFAATALNNLPAPHVYSVRQSQTYFMYFISSMNAGLYNNREFLIEIAPLIQEGFDVSIRQADLSMLRECSRCLVAPAEAYDGSLKVKHTNQAESSPEVTYTHSNSATSKRSSAVAANTSEPHLAGFDLSSASSVVRILNRHSRGGSGGEDEEGAGVGSAGSVVLPDVCYSILQSFERSILSAELKMLLEGECALSPSKSQNSVMESRNIDRSGDLLVHKAAQTKGRRDDLLLFRILLRHYLLVKPDQQNGEESTNALAITRRSELMAVLQEIHDALSQREVSPHVHTDEHDATRWTAALQGLPLLPLRRVPTVVLGDLSFNNFAKLIYGLDRLFKDFVSFVEEVERDSGGGEGKDLVFSRESCPRLAMRIVSPTTLIPNAKNTALDEEEGEAKIAIIRKTPKSDLELVRSLLVSSGDFTDGNRTDSSYSNNKTTELTNDVLRHRVVSDDEGVEWARKEEAVTINDGTTSKPYDTRLDSQQYPPRDSSVAAVFRYKSESALVLHVRSRAALDELLWDLPIATAKFLFEAMTKRRNKKVTSTSVDSHHEQQENDNRSGVRKKRGNEEERTMVGSGRDGSSEDGEEAQTPPLWALAIALQNVNTLASLPQYYIWTKIGRGERFHPHPALSVTFLMIMSFLTEASVEQHIARFASSSSFSSSSPPVACSEKRGKAFAHSSPNTTRLNKSTLTLFKRLTEGTQKTSVSFLSARTRAHFRSRKGGNTSCEVSQPRNAPTSTRDSNVSHDSEEEGCGTIGNAKRVTDGDGIAEFDEDLIGVADEDTVENVSGDEGEEELLADSLLEADLSPDEGSDVDDESVGRGVKSTLAEGEKERALNSLEREEKQCGGRQGVSSTGWTRASSGMSGEPLPDENKVPSGVENKPSCTTTNSCREPSELLNHPRRLETLADFYLRSDENRSDGGGGGVSRQAASGVLFSRRDLQLLGMGCAMSVSPEVAVKAFSTTETTRMTRGGGRRRGGGGTRDDGDHHDGYDERTLLRSDDVSYRYMRRLRNACDDRGEGRHSFLGTHRSEGRSGNRGRSGSLARAPLIVHPAVTSLLLCGSREDLEKVYGSSLMGGARSLSCLSFVRECFRESLHVSSSLHPTSSLNKLSDIPHYRGSFFARLYLKEGAQDNTSEFRGEAVAPTRLPLTVLTADEGRAVVLHVTASFNVALDRMVDVCGGIGRKNKRNK